jgi:hypothetical protein
MSNLPEQTAPLYATDEDILVRAGADFITLCPAWQQMAAGTDGYFTAGTPWVFNSVSVNFQNNSVSPNQVLWITGPKSAFPGTVGQLLAIDTVNGSSLTLRRPYKDLNIGQPPGPAAGLSGISFLINTLDPQTANASFDIKRRFGIDENIPGRTSSWVYDLEDVRMATVLTVLRERYMQETRSDRGDFARKAKQMDVELQLILDRVQVRWGPLGNSAEPATLFSCKISR